METLHRFAIAFIAALTMSGASAGVITYDDYVYDDSTDYVVGGGLEWLRWDVTLGQSINDAVAAYSGDGYRVANNTDMAALFEDFAFAPPGYWDTDEDSGQTAPLLTASDNTVLFNSMFGITHTAASQYSLALFGDDADGDDFINLANVNSPYLASSSEYAAELEGDNSWTAAESESIFGVALVRTHVATSVPEPSMLLLLVSGFLGFSLRSRSRKA